MPIVGAPAYKIPTSDDFSSPTLGLHGNYHNPDNTRWSLTARPGFLGFSYRRDELLVCAEYPHPKRAGAWSGAEVKFDLSNLSLATFAAWHAGKDQWQYCRHLQQPGNYTLSMI